MGKITKMIEFYSRLTVISSETEEIILSVYGRMGWQVKREKKVAWLTPTDCVPI